MIKSIVKTIPKNTLIEVLMKTIETQMNGGMTKIKDSDEDQEMTTERSILKDNQDNSKRLKTAGGVFLTFLR